MHGFPDSSRVWRKQLRPLVESGRRVIVPDLRGMGNSDRPEGVDAYRGTVIVADLLAVLDAHEVERAHVIGHDWGAGLRRSASAATLITTRVRLGVAAPAAELGTALAASCRSSGSHPRPARGPTAR